MVLNGIDLDVQAGTIVGLIGPSGCGKTTLIRALVGIHEPNAGEICVLGTEPSTFTAQRARIGYMPQLPALFPNLSVIDNLRFAATSTASKDEDAAGGCGRYSSSSS